MHTHTHTHTHRYASAFALLQRMLNFVQNLQYYMMFEVLEPNWSILEQNLRSVTTIDDVLAVHTDFLDKCLRDCMLSSRELLKIISRLMVVCNTFTSHMQKATQDLEVASLREENKLRQHAAKPQKRVTRLLSADLEQIVSSDSFEHTLANFDKNFTDDLKELLDKLYSLNTDTVGSMIARLDFNGYYRERVS